MAQGETHEGARGPPGPRSAIARRRGTAGTTSPSAPGATASGLGQQLGSGDRVAQDGLAEPVEGLAGGVHRSAQEPPARDRSGRPEDAGQLDRPVGVDREPAARPARVDCLARLEQARAEEAGMRVGHPRDDRDARLQSELHRRPDEERPEDRAGGLSWRDPLGGQPGPRHGGPVRMDLSGQGRLRGDPAQTEPDPLPAGQVPAGRGGDARPMTLGPERAGQDPEDPAGLAGGIRKLGLLGRHPGVQPGRAPDQSGARPRRRRPASAPGRRPRSRRSRPVRPGPGARPSSIRIAVHQSCGSCSAAPAASAADSG